MHLECRWENPFPLKASTTFTRRLSSEKSNVPFFPLHFQSNLLYHRKGLAPLFSYNRANVLFCQRKMDHCGFPAHLQHPSYFDLGLAVSFVSYTSYVSLVAMFWALSGPQVRKDGRLRKGSVGFIVDHLWYYGRWKLTRPAPCTLRSSTARDVVLLNLPVKVPSICFRVIIC